MALARGNGPLRTLAVLALALAASACATIPPDAGSNPVDPWERYNRHMFEVNDTIDRNVVKPVAEGYEKFVPRPIRSCIGNVFANVRDLPIALNNLLQGKPVEAVSDVCRVVINSTVGLLGCFDVASRMGLPKHNEDFGQTLGRWGFGSGPYFVLPLLGPSSVRDAIGRLPDTRLDPQLALPTSDTRLGVYLLNLLDLRASLLPAERAFDGIALDRYQFLRDAYLQRRFSLVHDGDPPRGSAPVYDDPDDDDDELPVGGKPAPPNDANKDQPK